MKHLLFAAAFLILACGSQTQTSGGYEVGDQARDFNLKGVSGDKISMNEDYPDAKGFIVIFSCNHCPYVKAYEDRMIQLHKDFAPKGYPVIAINPNDPEKYPEDSYENMKKRAENKNFPFNYVVDPTQEIAKTYGATRTPHVFLLDRKESGNLVVEYTGAIDDNTENPDQVENQYVRDAISALESGEKPERTNTKAIGCTIKWKDS